MVSTQDEIIIEPYASQSVEEIFELILPIQREEFGILIDRRSQPDLERIPSFYQQGAGNFWLAMTETGVVGTVALRDIGSQQVALRKMFVRADFRGKKYGVAKRLLDIALASAKANNVCDVFLGTTAYFHAAHRFYEKSGFTEIPKQELPPAFPVMDVDTKFYRMKLR